MENKILVIAGPTATGKSSLAIKIAKQYGGEIVNADSMQIYQNIPILSAQPIAEYKELIPHHLYGFFSYDSDADQRLLTKPYSVGNWVEDTKDVILDIRRRNKVPIIVGGTGLYINSLVNGISAIPDIDSKTELETKLLFQQLGNEAFFRKLCDLDPLSQQKLHVNDSTRIIRAYNVIKQTGQSIFTWHTQSHKKYFDNNEFSQILLLPPKTVIDKYIDIRFDKMVQDGAIGEVKALMSLENSADISMIKAIGVRQLHDFLLDKISKEEAISQAKVATKQYAKRQITWFKHQMKDAKIYDNIADIEEIIDNISL